MHAYQPLCEPAMATLRVAEVGASYERLGFRDVLGSRFGGVILGMRRMNTWLDNTIGYGSRC